MNSNVARGLFSSETFKSRLQRRGVERFINIANETKMMSDIVMEYRDYQNKSGKNTLLDSIRKVTNSPINQTCSFCSLSLEHSCVER